MLCRAGSHNVYMYTSHMSRACHSAVMTWWKLWLQIKSCSCMGMRICISHVFMFTDQKLQLYGDANMHVSHIYDYRSKAAAAWGCKYAYLTYLWLQCNGSRECLCSMKLSWIYGYRSMPNTSSASHAYFPSFLRLQACWDPVCGDCGMVTSLFWLQLHIPPASDLHDALHDLRAHLLGGKLDGAHEAGKLRSVDSP